MPSKKKIPWVRCWLCRQPIESFIEETISFSRRPAHWWCHDEEVQRRQKAAGLREEGKFDE